MLDHLLGEEPSFFETLYQRVRGENSFSFTEEELSSFCAKRVYSQSFYVANLLDFLGIYTFHEKGNVNSQYSLRDVVCNKSIGFLLYEDEILVELNSPDPILSINKKMKAGDFINIILSGKDIESSTLKLTVLNRSSLEASFFDLSFANPKSHCEYAKDFFKRNIDLFYDRLKIFFPELSHNEIRDNCEELVMKIDFDMISFKTLEAKRYFLNQLGNEDNVYTPEMIIQRSQDYDLKIYDLIKKIS